MVVVVGGGREEQQQKQQWKRLVLSEMEMHEIIPSHVEKRSPSVENQKESIWKWNVQLLLSSCDFPDSRFAFFYLFFFLPHPHPTPLKLERTSKDTVTRCLGAASQQPDLNTRRQVEPSEDPLCCIADRASRLPAPSESQGCRQFTAPPPLSTHPSPDLNFQDL